jgi:hypothetical protein
LKNPSLGVANTPYGRLLPPKYSDGKRFFIVYISPYSVLSISASNTTYKTQNLLATNIFQLDDFPHTALQAGTSRFGFPMVSLEFFIDIRNSSNRTTALGYCTKALREK